MGSRGSIFIFSLWIVALLTVFATQIGLHVRGRILLLSRLETRSGLRKIAEAGIEKAVMVMLLGSTSKSKKTKEYYYNNTVLFKDIELGGGFFNVKYDYYNIDNGGQLEERFGFIDEESKLNINRMGFEELQRLLVNTAFIGDSEADRVGRIIMYCRGDDPMDMSLGKKDSEYYEQLRYPYKIKRRPFKMLAELKLMDVMTDDIFQKIEPFLTVFGTGKVNINTAQKPVLVALGLNDELVNAIFLIRRGTDGIDRTRDDVIFEGSSDFQLIDDLNEKVRKSELYFVEDEGVQVYNDMVLGRVTGKSYYYRFRAEASFPYKKDILVVTGVYSLENNRFVYWRER